MSPLSPLPDDELRALFDAARRAEEAQAPSFRRILARRAARRVSRPRRAGWALAAAVALAVAISTWSVYLSPARPPAIPPGRIESWKPPTDFLLATPSTDLFDTLPALQKPVPDYARLLADEKGNTP